MIPKIGVIGGTGLYDLEDQKGFEKLSVEEVRTPWGEPSGRLTVARVGSHEVVFLPRHGERHQWLPSEVNYRANIWALKSLGVKQVIAVSATGSLKEEMAPGDLALVEQYIDFTKGKRASTFFGEGLVAHISTANPSCQGLARRLTHFAEMHSQSLHRGKTYGCVEGPRLGTRAESFFFRSTGAELLGMTNLPEAFLAREAQLCYQTIAIVTDYDCWKENPEEQVSVANVIQRYGASLAKVKKLLMGFLSVESPFLGCECQRSLEFAVLTQAEKLSPAKREILEFLKA